MTVPTSLPTRDEFVAAFRDAIYAAQQFAETDGPASGSSLRAYGKVLQMADTVYAAIDSLRETVVQFAPPQVVCGPTAGCGKAMYMVRATNVIAVGDGLPPLWKMPDKCPHCGKEQFNGVYLSEGYAVVAEPRATLAIRRDGEKA